MESASKHLKKSYSVYVQLLWAVCLKFLMKCCVALNTFHFLFFLLSLGAWEHPFTCEIFSAEHGCENCGLSWAEMFIFCTNLDRNYRYSILVRLLFEDSIHSSRYGLFSFHYSMLHSSSSIKPNTDYVKKSLLVVTNRVLDVSASFFFYPVLSLKPRRG